MKFNFTIKLHNYPAVRKPMDEVNTNTGEILCKGLYPFTESIQKKNIFRHQIFLRKGEAMWLSNCLE